MRLNLNRSERGVIRLSTVILWVCVGRMKLGGKPERNGVLMSGKGGLTTVSDGGGGSVRILDLVGAGSHEHRRTKGDLR
jgi:hypothetical protein